MGRIKKRMNKQLIQEKDDTRKPVQSILETPKEPVAKVTSHTQTTSSSKASKHVVPEPEDEGEDLGSGDDSDDDSEEPDTDNLIICTFEKVSRVKNKWKMSLKCGVMNLNGRDYLFHRATGEGEW